MEVHQWRGLPTIGLVHFLATKKHPKFQMPLNLTLTRTDQMKARTSRCLFQFQIAKAGRYCTYMHISFDLWMWDSRIKDRPAWQIGCGLLAIGASIVESDPVSTPDLLLHVIHSPRGFIIVMTFCKPDLGYSWYIQNPLLARTSLYSDIPPG